MLDTLIQIDSNILIFVQEHIRQPFLTPFVIIITNLGDSGIVWIVISVLLIVMNKTRKVGAMCLTSLLCSFIISNLLLKNLFARVRAFDIITGLEVLIARPLDYSFPSGHTASSFAAAFIIYRNLPKRFGIPAMILAILISMSRLYLGVHYPSDILFGVIMGILAGYLAEKIVNRLHKG